MQVNMTERKVGIFEPPAKPKITKEMKAALESSGLKGAGLKAALNEQYAAMKAKYQEDLSLWKAKPDVSRAEVEEYKKQYSELEKNAETRKQEAIKSAKAEREAAKNAFEQSTKTSDDRLALELALHHAKDVLHNKKLDLKEELRFNKDKMHRAILSPEERYKIKQGKALRSAIWRDRWLYVMLFPFILFFILFMYLPMPGLIIAFKDYSIRKGIWGSPWAANNGFYHFITFFSQPYAFRLIRNTFMINLYLIIFGFPVPIILALLLNEVRNKMFKTTIQTLSYLPHFVSIVVVCGLVTNFLSLDHGVINFLYKAITHSDKGIYFLTEPKYFRTIYVIMDIWKGAGFGSIIYVSALVGIDAELYEAARIDGAGRWRQLLSITLPGIMPTIAIMLIMRVGSILNLGYEAIILLYQPVTYEVADVISTYVFRVGLQENQFSLSTAVGLFNGLVALVMVTAANTISRKTGEVGLW